MRNEVLAKLPYTLILAVTSTLFAFLIGVPLGIWGALKQYTAIDAVILFLSVLFVSMPSFWLAMMLINKLAVEMNILPAIGNEFVTMVKETSIVQYLGISDLMYNNGIVVSATYNPLPCYYISAIIYLVLNILLGKGLSIFEGRLKKSEK